MIRVISPTRPAKAAMQRRDNLKRSAHDLKIQLEDAKAALSEAFEEVTKVELLDERNQMRDRADEEMGGKTEADTVDDRADQPGVAPEQARSTSSHLAPAQADSAIRY
jgi:flagellar protein FliJ